MKRILCVILLFFILVGCSNKKNSNLETLNDLISNHLDMPGYIKLSIEDAKNYYTLNSNDIDEFLIYISEDGLCADEVCVIKARDEDSKKRIKIALNDRLEEKRNSFRNYLPLEYEKICKSSVLEYGMYCYFYVSENGEMFKSAFSRAFCITTNAF